MNCREVQPLLQLFIDGELDARQMRGVALHSARCTPCEQELRFLENCQEAVAECVNAVVEEIDLSCVWSAVAPRLKRSPSSWGARLREWWEELDTGSLWRVPAYAGAAAVFVIAAGVWLGQDETRTAADERIARPPVRVARFDNSTIVDSIKSEAATVAMLREPETNTLVLWVNDDGSAPVVRTLGGGR